MSKLQQLIQELCSDGVKYKRLGDIAFISRGGNFQKKDFVEVGIPCIHYGQIYTRYGLYADKVITYISDEAGKKSKYAKPNDIIMAVTSENVGDVCKCVAWLGNEKIAVGGHSAIIHHNQNAKFLSDYFHSLHFYKQKVKLAHGTKVIEVTPDRLNEVQVPVPPIEVQCEIVRILDDFTELTTQLTSKLTEELIARNKQYEFYRGKLLSFDSEIQRYPLRELVDFRNGKGHEKDIVACGKYIVVNSKFISTNGEVRKYSNRQICPLYTNDILMVMSDLPNGRALAKCYLVEEDHKYTLNQRIGAFRVKSNIVNTKFLLYVLNRNQKLLNFDNGIDQTNLRKEDILNILIPIPSLDVQKRMVNVLENFDAICTKLNLGLPAEIEARQKQYEYYRDKLLSFEEVKQFC